MIVGFVVCMIVGLLCVVLGLLLWKKQMISLVHDYHHKNVQKSDVPAYTRLMGIGLLLIGVGTCLTGIINLAFQTGTGWIAFGIGFFAGIGLMIKSQMKYNGSLFS